MRTDLSPYSKKNFDNQYVNFSKVHRLQLPVAVKYGIVISNIHHDILEPFVIALHFTGKVILALGVAISHNYLIVIIESDAECISSMFVSCFRPWKLRMYDGSTPYFPEASIKQVAPLIDKKKEK